jgi:hypothetical protein
VTWSTVDTFPQSGSTAYLPYAIAADNAGNVYVVGSVSISNTRTGWIVRKGSAGTSWATVDQVSPQPMQGPYGSAYASGAFCHPTAGIFVVGQTSVAAKNRNGYLTVWTVRRSRDGGTSWTTVDILVPNAFSESSAAGVGADSPGNIYVVEPVLRPAPLLEMRRATCSWPEKATLPPVGPTGSLESDRSNATMITMSKRHFLLSAPTFHLLRASGRLIRWEEWFGNLQCAGSRACSRAS